MCPELNHFIAFANAELLRPAQCKKFLRALPLIPRGRAQGKVKLHVWPRPEIQSM